MDSKMENVKESAKLKGKTNFIGWKREFERAAKKSDILEYLTGKETVPDKPAKDDYFAKPPPRRSDRQKQTATPSVEEGEEGQDKEIVVVINNNLRWTIDWNEYKTAKEKMKLAGQLLDAWVTEGIKIEIEDCEDAKSAYDLIKKRYAVSDERARAALLIQLSSLKLEDCTSVTDYINKLRQMKADLKTVKYDMTDDMLATSLLHGLPSYYRTFKEKYDRIRSTTPDAAPDLDYFFERLSVEEIKQNEIKEDKSKKDKAKKEGAGNQSTGYHNNNSSSNNGTGNTSGGNNSGNSGGWRKPREDRSHLKCTYAPCGKTGHDEDHCWMKNPEKVPKALQGKINLNKSSSDNNTSTAAGMGGVADSNLSNFRDAYARADTLGNTPPLAPSTALTDSLPQTPSALRSGEVQGSGGVVFRGAKLAKLGYAQCNIQAFVAGASCTSETWLADTGCNTHIVNDRKWFKKGTFRRLDLGIATADASTSLEIKGGGDVQLILKCPDGFPMTVNLSEVAYAPKGKCNLFSGGMFASKTGMKGSYDDQYMTWIDPLGNEVGNATYVNGLYHLDVEMSQSPFESGEIVAAVIDFDDPVFKCHRRLGHLGFQKILSLLDASSGMNLTQK